MKIGIVYNPLSGDKRLHKRYLTILKEKLKDHTILCTKAVGEGLRDFFPFLEIVNGGSPTYSYFDSICAGKTLKDANFLIVLGGDGTIADVVRGQREAGISIPILGIGIGTANAGPFILIRNPEELEKLDFYELEPYSIGGLEVYENNTFSGVGFNDVVVSDTLISTLNGEVTTIDAFSFVKREKIKKEPSSVGRSDSRIFVNGKEIEIPFEISQIILSPIYNKERFMGKAIFGKLCWIPYSEDNASMIIVDKPVIRMLEEEEEREIPLLIAQFTLREKDIITLSRLNGYLIIDGNPRINLKEKTKIAKIKYNNQAGIALRRKR